jgi:hypothetical protein
MTVHDKTQGTERRIPRPVLVLIVLILSCALGVYVFRAGTAYFLPHCVPMDKLAAMRPGMSKQEVIGLLGSPQSEARDASNSRRLEYFKAGLYCNVTVHVDGENRVQGYQEASVFHDH